MQDALIEELSKPEYQDLNDWQASDLIRAKTITIRKPVELWRVDVHASERGYRAKLELAAMDPASPCREPAINILKFIDSRRLETVDMDLPKTREMLAGMIQCGFALQSHIDELIAMGDQQVNWADHHGIDASPRAVGLARGGK